MPQPRKLILQDLTHAIQHEQSKGHTILIMMGSNGSLDDDTDLQKFIFECDLTHLHESDPAPSAYISSSHQRKTTSSAAPKSISPSRCQGPYHILTVHNRTIGVSSSILKSNTFSIVQRLHQLSQRHYLASSKQAIRKRLPRIMQRCLHSMQTTA